MIPRKICALALHFCTQQWTAECTKMARTACCLFERLGRCLSRQFTERQKFSVSGRQSFESIETHVEQTESHVVVGFLFSKESVMDMGQTMRLHSPFSSSFFSSSLGASAAAAPPAAAPPAAGAAAPPDPPDGTEASLLDPSVMSC